LKFGTEFHEIESADASQAGAHPSLDVSKTVSNAGGFKSLGLALSEKQIPQIVDTVPNSKHGMERMEWLSVFAKQVLSQLSYTPTYNPGILIDSCGNDHLPLLTRAFAN